MNEKEKARKYLRAKRGLLQRGDCWRGWEMADGRWQMRHGREMKGGWKVGGDWDDDVETKGLGVNRECGMRCGLFHIIIHGGNRATLSSSHIT